MRNQSSISEEKIRVIAQDVWVGFSIRYHRPDDSIRAAFVSLLRKASGRKGNGGTRKEFFWGLRGVTLEAKPGEVVGVIGNNGSGKTTLLKTLAGIWLPDRGSVQVHGAVSCLMSFGVGFRPSLSGRENVYVNGSILGLPRREIDERLEGIIELSELGQFIDAPVQTYSAGMKSRLGFSIAVNVEPDVLLLDEVLAVGDAGFRARAGSILDRLRDRRVTIFLVSHNAGFVERTCSRAIWLDAGSIRADGPSGDVVAEYRRQSA